MQLTDGRLAVIRREADGCGLASVFRELERYIFHLEDRIGEMADRLDYRRRVRWPWSISSEYLVLWASFLYPESDEWLRERLFVKDFCDPINASLWMALDRRSIKSKVRSLACWHGRRRRYGDRCAMANWLECPPEPGWFDDCSWKVAAKDMRDLRIRRAESFIACCAMYRASLRTETGEGLDRLEALIADYRTLETSKWE